MDHIDSILHNNSFSTLNEIIQSLMPFFTAKFNRTTLKANNISSSLNSSITLIHKVNKFRERCFILSNSFLGLINRLVNIPTKLLSTCSVKISKDESLSLISCTANNIGIHLMNIPFEHLFGKLWVIHIVCQ